MSTALVRRGSVLHQLECPRTHEHPPVPWAPPAGADPRRAAADQLLRLCTTCRPLGGAR